ncbi:recombination regulator RecX [Peribacillus alkalitolerans]|uniref:recombination regulator RecX n=1 Tax=Peribacillus alkalitolerans TaxID=1550385 RepID=UPI0013D83A82|nr:recombination regulator RecX [Peribacillus alkalitolerans]
MAIITKIAVQKKLKDRYNIYIDKGNGEEYGFSVSEDTLIKLGLKKGMEVDEFELSEISYRESIQKAYTQAVHYLSIRMRSEQEIRHYLREKEAESHVIQEVIHKLAGQGYLNDLEFALAYVRTQINTTKKGPVVIKNELQEKGIKGEMLEQALEQYTPDLQLHHAIDLLEKANKKPNKQSIIQYRMKVEQQLTLKGYQRSIIQKALEESFPEENENQEWGSLVFQGEKLSKKYSKYEGFEYLQKMKTALYRKGFSIDMIQKYLEEDEK